MTVVSLPGSASSLTLAEAVARFLDRYRDQEHTATTYAETLTHLRTVAGDASAAGALTPEVFAAAMTRWDGSAPATWNRHLAALRSFAGYALRQEWLTGPGPAAGTPQGHRARRQGDPRRAAGGAAHR
jgi:hypothetical protein